MEKLTKRKAFNFLRSYFDVLNKIEKDEDKLSFLMSIINKQFLDEDPEGLNFLVDLCYLSQKHAIETSVKGWKRVNKTDVMGNPMTDPTTNPTTNPTTDPQEEEEEEEVEEEEKVEEKDKDRLSDFEIFWETYNKKVGRKDVERKFLSLSQKDVDKILRVVKIYVDSVEPKWKKLPKTWLNGEHWNDEITSVKKVSYSGKQKIFL